MEATFGDWSLSFHVTLVDGSPRSEALANRTDLLCRRFFVRDCLWASTSWHCQPTRARVVRSHLALHDPATQRHLTPDGFCVMALHALDAFSLAHLAIAARGVRL